MESKLKLVIASGYFNPVHEGHIEYLEKAKELGDKLLVIVNNDEQVTLKGSKPFQTLKQRTFITSKIKGVDMIMASIDTDRSVNETLYKIWNMYKDKYEIIFTNGGDVDKCLEEEVCKALGIKIVYGLGEKIQSSSKLKSLL